MYEKKKQPPWARVLVICIGLACGLTIGVGIGYRIANDTEEDVTSKEDRSVKISGCADPGPTPTWLELPCETDPGPVCPEGYSRPPLLLISLDGFRAEYLARGLTPNIQKLVDCGVSAPYMMPMFPSYTFPNHYSIVTGMYPEAHGIVANSMYDPEMGKSFSLSSDEKLNPEWWEDGIPIWETAERNGMKTGAFFWPGSDVKIHGMYPSYWSLYAGGVSYMQRVLTLLSWLSMPDEALRPVFLNAYFDEPDGAGHDFGPISNEVDAMLVEMDNLMGYLMDGVVELNLTNCLDIIIVSDHGMAPVACNRTFFCHDYINSDDYYIRNGAITRLDPKWNAAIQDPDEIVAQFQCQHENMAGYAKWDLPKNWHYANNIRIEEAIVVSDEEYYISIKLDEFYDPSYCSGGNHGWDQRGKQMESLFLAHGPSFKHSTVVEPFYNIELYPLMAEILGVAEEQNNATTGSLSHLLKNPKPIPLPDLSGSSPAGSCPYPVDQTAYDTRRAQDTSGCTCASEPNLELYDDRLDLSQPEADASKAKHLPFGATVVNHNTSHCDLVNFNYITGFDSSRQVPLWAAYTVDRSTPRLTYPLTSDCARADVRVPDADTPACTDYSLPGVTYEKGFNVHAGIWEKYDEQMDTLITSNMLPMKKNFTQEIWNYMGNNIVAWADLYNGVNVISGAIFDYNYDGHRDNDTVLLDNAAQSQFGNTWVPSHYYVIVTRCPGEQAYGAACQQDLEVLPFIFRDSEGIEPCQTPERYIQLDIATVREIEILTQLSFFPDLPIEKAVQLKLYQNRDIWPTV